MDVTRALFTGAWGAVIVMGAINVAMIFYAVNKKLQPLEEHFKQWRSPSIDEIFVDGGLYGKIVQLSVISVLISSKKNQNKEPSLNEAVQSLPKSLRFWATCPFHVAYFVTGASISLWLYGKYSGLLR